MVSKIVYGFLIKTSEHFLLFSGGNKNILLVFGFSVTPLHYFMKEPSSLAKENVNYSVDEDRSINRDWFSKREPTCGIVYKLYILMSLIIRK